MRQQSYLRRNGNKDERTPRENSLFDFLEVMKYEDQSKAKIEYFDDYQTHPILAYSGEIKPTSKFRRMEYAVR